jgi:hypothetical protein
MPDLKLIALDTEDLNVLSAHLQDAVLRVADMAYLPKERRFAVILNRFDWQTAATPQPSAGLERRRAGLRFERVLGAKVHGIDLSDKTASLALLAVTFAPSGAPEEVAGDVTLTFSGGAAIRLSVECVEAELKDLGAVWAAKRAPHHGQD